VGGHHADLGPCLEPRSLRLPVHAALDNGNPAGPGGFDDPPAHLPGELGRDVHGLVRKDRGRVGQQDEVIGNDDGAGRQSPPEGPRRVYGDDGPDAEGLEGREIGPMVDEVRQDVSAGLAVVARDVGNVPGEPEGHPSEFVDRVFLPESLEDARPVQHRPRDDADGRHGYLDEWRMAYGIRLRARMEVNSKTAFASIVLRFSCPKPCALSLLALPVYQNRQGLSKKSCPGPGGQSPPAEPRDALALADCLTSAELDGIFCHSISRG